MLEDLRDGHPLLSLVISVHRHLLIRCLQRHRVLVVSMKASTSMHYHSISKWLGVRRLLVGKVPLGVSVIS